MSTLLLIPLLFAAERTLVDKVVAVVNDDVVLLSELEETARAFIPADATPELRREGLAKTLETLIADKLVSQQVKEAKIDVTPDDVDRAVQDILRQNEITLEQLTDAIEARGMTLAQYKSDLEGQIVRMKLVDLKVRSRVVVAEADMQDEHKRRVAGMKREELISLSHLFFRWGESPDPAEKARVLARAEAARARVQNGEDFATVAKELSEGPTAASGGSLGELTRKGLLPELAKAVGSLAPQTLSAPVETANGVHVLRIDAVKQKDPPSYESMRNEIYRTMYQAEVERQMKLWIDELREQAAVQIRLDAK